MRAQQDRRRRREAREELLAQGVTESETLYGWENGEVDNVHFLDAAWLTDAFMATLKAAPMMGSGGVAAAGAADNEEEEEAQGDDDLLHAFVEVLGDELDEEASPRPLPFDGEQPSSALSLSSGLCAQ